MIGPLLLGAAVANTIATIVEVPPSEQIAVIGAGLTGAVVWNVVTWLRGLPASSSHALVGGLVGAALVAAGVSAVTGEASRGGGRSACGGADRARGLAGPGFWGTAGLTACPCARSAARQPACSVRSARASGRLRVARFQPRLERRAEGRGRGGRPPVGARLDRLALGAGVGDARLRRRAHVRDRARRMEHRPDDRESHHPSAPTGRVDQQHGLGGGYPRLLPRSARRRARHRSSRRQWSARGSDGIAPATSTGTSSARSSSRGSPRFPPPR